MNCKQHMILAALLTVSSWISAAPKNFIVILTDDQGYGDLGCFGSTRIKTPNIDRMATEGIKLTSFYVAASICTPSRGALLTGRMPKRIGLARVGAPARPEIGLSSNEVTIAMLLKKKKYTTAIIGKWHLGHTEEFLPTQHGFDSFWGIPYSNDMSISPGMKVAPNVVLNEGYTLDKLRADEKLIHSKAVKGKVPLMLNKEISEYPADQTTLTQRYTERAVTFINENKEKPFFLYLAHAFPHRPIHVGKAFKGSSGHGDYCDSIQEIDWSVGQVLEAIEKNNLQKDTLVIFTSDNGQAGAEGSAGPLRGRKTQTYEGGMRVPGIVWAPGTIPAGSVSDQMLSTLDILPTIAHYTDIALPDDRIYDGFDVSALLEGRTSKSPRNTLFFYSAASMDIDGIRLGDWKYLNRGYKPEARQKPHESELCEKLFNLRDDIGEKKNLFSAYPEKVEELKRQMHHFDASVTQPSASTE